MRCVLRHDGSGRVLTDGLSPDRPLRFPSRDDAEAFAGRFLDEARAWQVVDADTVDGERAA